MLAFIPTLRVVKTRRPVTQGALFQNRDFPVLNDYRSVLGGLFARLYGLSLAQCEQVFAGVAPKDLGLLSLHAAAERIWIDLNPA
jgi:hypothetical protein